MFLDEKIPGIAPVETKPDILSLSTLIAWLEKHPADEAYDYDNCKGHCLIGRYMAAHGYGWYEPGISYDTFCLSERDWGFRIAVQRPHTFGAALERARALREQRK